MTGAKVKKILMLAAAAMMLLSACGGGGGSAGTASVPNDAVAGFFKGTAGTRDFDLLSFRDGEVYAFYSRAGAPSSFSGLIHGNGSVSGNTISGTFPLVEFESGTAVPDAVQITATTSAGTVTGTVGSPPTAFTGTKDPNSSIAPTLASLTGTYTGTVVVSSSTQTGTVTMSATGVIGGSSASGCTYTGQATPRPAVNGVNVNAFNISVTYGGAPCANANTTYTGAAYYYAAATRFYMAAVDATLNSGFIFIGSR
jgi:hypothetical protein